MCNDWYLGPKWLKTYQILPHPNNVEEWKMDKTKVNTLKVRIITTYSMIKMFIKVPKCVTASVICTSLPPAHPKKQENIDQNQHA